MTLENGDEGYNASTNDDGALRMGGENDEIDLQEAYNTLRNKNGLYLNTNPEGFKFVHLFKDRVVAHEVPWRECTPNPDLVKKSFLMPRRQLVVADMYITVTGWEALADRPLNTQEVSAMAYYSSKRQQTISLYWQGGMIVGALLWWRSRKTLKMPFWRTPKDTTKYEVFPHKRIPIFTGPAARTAWYTQRLGLYLAASLPFGYAMGVSSAGMALNVGIKNDPRLQDLLETVKRKMKEGRTFGQIRQEHARNQDVQQDVQQESAWSQREPIQGSGTTASEDSPAQQSKEIGFPPSRRSLPRMPPGNDGQQQERSYESGAQDSGDRYSYSRDSSSTNDKDRYAGASSSTSSSESAFDWDDASPTAGNEPDPSLTSSSATSSSSIGGSAWERLRQESLAKQRGGMGQDGPRSPTPPYTSTVTFPPSPGSMPFESGSDSSSNGDKNAARSQAQKEFDEMMERERQGGDDSGSGWGGFRG